MKRIKQLLTLLLAVLLVCSLTLPAFATQEGTLTGGSITINNAVEGQTYSIYQILYLESYNSATGAYAYKANSAWEAWLRNQTTYVSFDDQDYVTWVKKTLTCSNVEEGHTHTDACYDFGAAEFAKAAREYATTIKEGSTTANVAPDVTKAAENTTVTFTDLKLGYYLVDSTLGTLCSLDTTNSSVTIQEKNVAPANDKTVEEDSTNVYGKTNDADIGQTVNFKSTITAQTGAENYVFYDMMSEGLTYNNDAKVYTDAAMTQELAAANYTVDNTAVADSYTFKITFAKSYLDTITAETKLYVKYSAKLNENAVVGLDGNSNKSWLSYGDTNNTKSTPESETKTYTWDVDVLKYANGNEATVLAGVKFVLLKKVNGTDTFAVVDSNGKITGWTTEGVKPETGADDSKTYATVLTTNASGKIEIDGLDADTYYLREIEALPGFNILSGDKEFTITGETTPAGSDTPTNNTLTVKVENKSGTELPSTGGMGTTLFYVIGGTLVLAAVVLLVTKKRMKAEG